MNNVCVYTYVINYLTVEITGFHSLTCFTNKPYNKLHTQQNQFIQPSNTALKCLHESHIFLLIVFFY